MTALAAPIALRTGWLRALWAAAVGWVVAGLGALLLRSVLSETVRWPDPVGRAPGVGWPWRIEGWWSVAADIGPALLAVALATATVSYGRTNALSAEWGPVSTSTRGQAYLTIPLRGLGHDIVNLESVRVPGHPDVVIRSWNWIGSGVGVVDGLSIFPGDARSLALRLPQGCSAPIRVDRLDVHMKVGDRAHHQVVRLGWMRDVPCG